MNKHNTSFANHVNSRLSALRMTEDLKDKIRNRMTEDSFVNIADKRLPALSMTEDIKQNVLNRIKGNTFADQANERLSSIQMTENMKHKVLSRIRQSLVSGYTLGHIPLRTAAVLVLLLMTATAFALTDGFGIFSLMSHVLPNLGNVQEQAQGMVQKELAEHSFEHVDVKITEAVYDGKYIHVAYSVRDRDATEPFTQDDVDGLSDYHSFDAAAKDNVSWQTLDWIEVDGVNYYPLGYSGNIAGPQPGEVVSWVQFDLTGAVLNDTFRVHLPIVWKDSPEELDFTMRKGGLQGVYNLDVPQDTRVGNHIIRIQEALFTPIRIYFRTELIFDAGVPMDEVAELTWKWMDEAKLTDQNGDNPLLIADWAGGFTGDNHAWVKNMKGEYEDQIVNPSKPVSGILFHEFIPLESYPDFLRFGVGEDSVLITHIKPD